MKSRILLALSVAGFSLAGCIPSVNPFYRAQDVVYDPALVGEWQEDGSAWTFERFVDGDAYLLTILEDNDRGIMKATLFTLGDQQYLDLTPEEFDFPDDQSEWINLSLFPGHMVLHVTEIEPVLRMVPMDADVLSDMLEEKPRALDHRWHGDRLLLTGETRQLQRFLRQHTEAGELFPAEEASEMTKRQPEGG